MDLDPLSFFANEAEKKKPVDDPPLPPSTHHVSDISELQKELEVDSDWIDKDRRNSKRLTRSSNDIVSGRGLNTPTTSKATSTVTTARTSTTSPDTKGSDSPDIPSLEVYVKMLTGEATLIKLPDVLIQLYPAKLIPGTLFMTTYRLCFSPSPAHLTSIGVMNPSVYSMFNVPLACIDKIEREKKQSKPQSILISCKDLRQLRIFLKGKTESKATATILSDDEIERAYSAMCRCAFPNNIRFVFAFTSAIPSSLSDFSPAEPFNMEREFSRQGVFQAVNGRPTSWRLSNANSSFKLCSSYPKLLVVPATMDDVQLRNVASFRSGQRFPALSYFHSNNGASIWRSSQPKAGVSGSNVVDERFLDLIARSTASRVGPTGETRSSKPMLFIIDCRPKSSALANRAAGAGYEVSNNYPNTQIEFFNIGNIHVMRDTLKNMATLFTVNTSVSNDTSFGKAVEDVGWLTHVRLVLKASWDCAKSVVKGVPVLVHCSHGWDRTSQVLCLAQMLLDPYFRTFDGFATLVEKDFISFGHPFQMRCGHGFDSHTRPDNEMSPIFLQFLDCTYQLVSQFPHYFEFSTKYVLVVLDHVYSCRFGTFLGNSDKEREQMGRDDCTSLWSYIKYNKALLRNPHYLDPFLEDTPTTHILLPNLSKILRNVTVWKEFFYRWSSVPSIIDPPHAIFREIHDDGILHPVSEAIRDNAQDLQLDHSDFDIPSLSCANDSWEALYLRERKLRMALQQQLSSHGDNFSPCVPVPSRDTKLPEVIEEGIDDVSAELDNLEIKEPNTFFANGKDDYGLLDSNSPAQMFGEDESGDKVDLLAIAALNDKEKETTDDEGDHVLDEENEIDETSDSQNIHVSPATVQVQPEKCQHKTAQVLSHDVLDEEECDSLRQTIEKQQEEIEKLKALLLSGKKGNKGMQHL